jgi:hypothetical protein
LVLGLNFPEILSQIRVAIPIAALPTQVFFSIGERNAMGPKSLKVVQRD